MSTERKIIVTFDDAGEMKLEAFGYRGHGCKRTIDTLLADMGAAATISGNKAEYFERDGDGNVRVKAVGA